MNRTRIVAGSNMAADYPLVIKDYVSYLKITLRINFKIKIEYVKLLFLIWNLRTHGFVLVLID